MKATYCIVNGKDREIWKDPITDSGKKSKRGLLTVQKQNGKLVVKDQCTWEEEQTGELRVVFEDGKLMKDWTLAEVRDNVKKSLEE